MEKSLIHMEFVETNNQLVDILTKALDFERFPTLQNILACVKYDHSHKLSWVLPHLGQYLTCMCIFRTLGILHFHSICPM